jgi:hypothetical protein
MIIRNFVDNLDVKSKTYRCLVLVGILLIISAILFRETKTIETKLISEYQLSQPIENLIICQPK